MPSTPNRLLLLCGLLAGLLFSLSWFGQGLLRADYNPWRHAVSSLSVGPAGWVQILTFVVTGSLVFGFSFALAKTFSLPGGSVWGPRLVGLMGLGLIGAGLFVTDPLNGYPPGTPLLPSERTTHGILHDLFGVPFFLGLPIACLIFARAFGRQGRKNWALYSVLTGIGMFVIFFVARLGFRLLDTAPALAAYFGLLQRKTITLGFAWLTLLALDQLNASRRPRAAQGN